MWPHRVRFLIPLMTALLSATRSVFSQQDSKDSEKKEKKSQISCSQRSMQRLLQRTARLLYRASVRSGQSAGRIIKEWIHQLTFELSAEDVFVLLNTVLRGTFQRTQKRFIPGGCVRTTDAICFFTWRSRADRSG